MDNEVYFRENSDSTTDKHDKFCWTCHKRVNIRAVCCNCFRSFHKHCVDYTSNGWSCPVCVKLEDAKKEQLKKPINIRKLTTMIDNVLGKSEFKMFEFLRHSKLSAKCNINVIKPMDLATIEAKIKLNVYSCIEECLNDIACIHHNCFVCFNENHALTLAATHLLEFCSNEISFMKDCVNCYENYCKSPKDCVLACDLPHLVVWINITGYKFWPVDKGFNYWPAKLVGIGNGAAINICLFGHVQYLTVKSTDCYLYSNQCSYFKCSELCDPRDIEAALQQADLYMKNVCNKFGVFANNNDDCILFDSQCVDEQLDLMFPGLGNKIQQCVDSSVIGIQESIVSHTVNKGHDLPPAKKHKLTTGFDSSSVDNVSECKQYLHKCINDVSSIIETVFDVNAKLDEELKCVEKRHTEKVNSLLKDKMEMHKTVELLKRNMDIQMIDLKAEHARHILHVIEESEEKSEYKLRLIKNEHLNEIGLLKSRFEQKIGQFETERKKFFSDSYNLIERKQEENERAVSQAIERCKREYETLINDAKGTKYCMACGAGKPLDLYVCNSDCQRRYYSRMS